MENLNDVTPEGMDASGFDYDAVLAAGGTRDVDGGPMWSAGGDAARATNAATRDPAAEHDTGSPTVDGHDARADYSPEYPPDYDPADDSPGEPDPLLDAWAEYTPVGAAARFDGPTHTASGPDPEDPEDPDGPDDDGPTHAADGTTFKREPAARQVIQLDHARPDLAATTAEKALLAARTDIYRRDRELVRPCVREVRASQAPDGADRTTLAPGLATMTKAALADDLCPVVDFQQFDGRTKELRPVPPPGRVVDTILSRQGRWLARPIAGVITTPTLRPDGSVLRAQGYDPATRLFHHADRNLKLRPFVDDPSRKHAEWALRALSDLLVEFPFIGLKEAGNRPERTVFGTVALSAIITAVVRGAMPVAPMHVLNAYTAGTGKSYLADVISAVAMGQPCPAMSFPPHDTVENEKKLVGALLDGATLVSLDNVNGELGGDLLCQAAERPILQLRRLGATGNFEVENRITLLATGNNLQVRGDMTRRVLVCDMDAGVERPEQRGFTGKPVDAVLADRSKYVSAALVIVRSYVLAGCPDRLPNLASYEDWTRLVPSALVWLGCANPLDSMERAREDDPERAELREVMALWDAAFGASPLLLRDAVSEAEQRVAGTDADGDPTIYGGGSGALRYSALADVLKRVSGGRVAIDGKRLGKWLSGQKGKIVGGRRFLIDGTTDGSNRWKLERV